MSYPACVQSVFDLIDSSLDLTGASETERYYSTFDPDCSRINGFRELLYAYAAACSYCTFSENTDISNCEMGGAPPECGESGMFSYSMCSGSGYVQIFPDGIVVAASGAIICVYVDQYGNECAYVDKVVTATCVYSGEPAEPCDCCCGCCSE